MSRRRPDIRHLPTATCDRTRTGAPIVAVVRAETVHPSPTPEYQFFVGDKVIMVGTDDGVDAAARLLARR